MAHTGPSGPGAFVHLDAARPWSEAGGAGRSLEATLVHELGHVLGLDHTPDPGAVLFSAFSGEATVELAASDRAGLASLYGGGVPGPVGPGDLALLRADGEQAAPVLRGVVPPGVSEWTLFDVEGDGTSEVVVRRTDREGGGSLTYYHFDPGVRLARTTGPLYGVCADGYPAVLGRTAAGERLLIVPFEGEPALVRSLDDRGLPRPREGPFVLEDGTADADGDGRLEGTPAAALGRPARLEADLDGDGEREVVVSGGTAD